jgi:Ser/Thr protein kinase RdoA (MazF antagonist)
MLSPNVTQWLAGVTGGPVEAIEQIGGSTTSSVWRCIVGDRGRRVVVKAYDRPALALEAEQLVRREVEALTVAAAAAIATPKVVAADPAGTDAGVPVVVMTEAPGLVRARPEPDPEAWLRGLADVVHTIDAAPVATDGLSRYEHWDTGPVETPVWATDAGPWRAMDAIIGTEIPAAPWRFIHRDLHPLNVLWADGAVSAVVDWPNACVGPIEADLARCRVNIALVSDPDDPLALADRLTELVGLPYDTRWDLTVAAGFLASDGASLMVGNELGAGLTREGIRRAIDAVVRAAVG